MEASGLKATLTAFTCLIAVELQRRADNGANEEKQRRKRFQSDGILPSHYP